MGVSGLPIAGADRLPDLRQLALFVSVAETGSISRAAAAHDLSQPAASAAMRALERRLGVRLLRRTTTGSSVTPAGGLVAAWARGVLEATDELLAGVAALAGPAAPQLRVAASLTIAEHLLPGWITALNAEWPGLGVQLEVVNSTRVGESVRGGHAELGFVESPLVPDGLAAARVGTDELVVVVAPGHPWARRPRPLAAAELAAAALVVREAGSGTRDTLEQALAAHRADGPAPAPVAELGSTTAVLSTIAGGVAAGVVSRRAADRELAAGRLTTVAVADLDLTRPLHAVWLPGHRPQGPAYQLLRIAREPV